MRTSKSTLVALSLAALGACAVDPGVAAPRAPRDAGATPELPDAAAAIDATPAPREDGGAAVDAGAYPTILELHALAVAPTCALNGGVCHNASSYPDLRTASSLLATIGLPCGLSAVDYDAIPDACESRGDRFVVAGAGLDREVADVTIAEVDPIGDEVSAVTLFFDDALSAGELAGLGPTARGFTMQRDDRALPLDPPEAVWIESASGRSVTLRVAPGTGDAIARFLDVRGLAYPVDAHVRWADANGNGLHPSTEPMPLIVPGRPLESYLVRRLVDPSFGELMPRQCRTWSDDATRALACWIAGLETDASGAVTNAYEPIDLAACDVELPAGRCRETVGTGFDAVEVILGRSCGGTGCHIGEASPAAGLDLSSGRARTSLLAPSTQCPSEQRVAPGDPDASYLLCKLAPSCDARGATAAMPAGGSLRAEDVEVIRAWIAAGAP